MSISLRNFDLLQILLRINFSVKLEGKWSQVFQRIHVSSKKFGDVRSLVRRFSLARQKRPPVFFGQISVVFRICLYELSVLSLNVKARNVSWEKLQIARAMLVLQTGLSYAVSLWVTERAGGRG